MSLFILPLTIAFLASILTFFSWFWVGTILFPVFAIFFPLDIAIAMTWIVHLLNNLFKLLLVWKYFDKKIVLKLWITWIIGAILWAYLLLLLSNLDLKVDYKVFWYLFETDIFKIIIGLLLIIFSIVEISPKLKNINFSNTWIYITWLLSWFFGWLSGHQGALRTAVLVKLNLEKTVFIATGVVIAVMIDITRIPIYLTNFKILDTQNLQLIVLTTISAFLGSFIWSKLLKKVTIRFIQILVSMMLVLMWILITLWIV